MMRAVVLLLCAVLLGMLPVQAALTAEKLGLTLAALSAEDLDAIEGTLGYRVGVQVTAVAPNTPAAKAGLKANDVIFTLGDKGIDSPKAFDTALVGKTGKLEIVGMRWVSEEKVEPFKVALVLPTEEATTGKPTTKPADPKPAAKPDEATQKKLRALEQAHEAGVLSDEEYAKKRAELLKGTTATDKPGSKAGTPAPGAYRHPLGFAFQCPKGWTVKEIDGGVLQLTPPNVATNAQGAVEAYLLSGVPMVGMGITSIADPRVAAHLDAEIQKQVPALQRTKPGAPLTRKDGGDGMLFEWDAATPMGTLHARAYTCLATHYGLALVGIGIKEKVTGREAELRGLFSTLEIGVGQRDTNVVGRWHKLSTYTLKNDSPFVKPEDRASSVSDNNTTVELRPDGTVVSTELSRTIAGGSGVWIDTGDQKTVKQGIWNAGDGQLFILWQDNTANAFRYTVKQTADGVILQTVTGTQGQNWKRL